MNTTPEQSYGDARQRLILIVLAVCSILGSLQFTLIVPVLPRIPLMLDISVETATWLATATLLVGTVATPVLARLADMYGRRRLLTVALLLLALGSVVAALGTSFTVVLIGRATQGFASALLPICIGLLSGSVNPTRTRLGISLMSGGMSLGSGLGLTLSGPLVVLGGLPAIFWTSAIASVVVAVILNVVVRETPENDPGRFDFAGTASLAIGLTLVLVVISHLASWGMTPTTIACLTAGLIALAIWVPWERRHPSPVIDLKVSFSSPVAQINLASFFGTFGMYANHLITMQVALAPPGNGYGLGLSLASAGLVLLPSTLSGVLFAPVASRAIARLGARRTLVLGGTIMSAAYAFHFFFLHDLATLVAGSTLVGVGTAFAFAAMPNLVTQAVAPRQVSAANGVNALARSLSGAFASAALALVLVSLPVADGDIFLSPIGLSLSIGVAALATSCCTVLAFMLPRSPERLR